MSYSLRGIADPRVAVGETDGAVRTTERPFVVGPTIQVTVNEIAVSRRSHDAAKDVPPGVVFFVLGRVDRPIEDRVDATKG